MTIEQAVLENLQDLPTEKQQQVLDFIKFLKQQMTIKLESSSQGSRKSYKGIWADLNRRGAFATVGIGCAGDQNVCTGCQISRRAGNSFGDRCGSCEKNYFGTATGNTDSQTGGIF